ncbi:hypothetical protein [Bradyrhizobium sp. CCGUVB14]|uniref:hypothetical protein n=1 Tax=Bradyrhizobium sp. CCGUVB14 TaxID=2949628 RepID=UPI0020B2EFC4|nr:hypothetical protein [Bradyrhizobium sp. CCGUVB14]MCP3445155.1 hypothetical protein [Bradyrhizobium sp. CCGUVB14]
MSNITIAFLRKSEIVFSIGHSNDKKHSYNDGKYASLGSGLLSSRALDVLSVCFCSGVDMRATNATDLARLESAAQDPNENVYDLGLKQDERSRLRRIEDLKRENALLTLVFEQTQLEVERLRELLSGT